MCVSDWTSYVDTALLNIFARGFRRAYKPRAYICGALFRIEKTF